MHNYVREDLANQAKRLDETNSVALALQKLELATYMAERDSKGSRYFVHELDTTLRDQYDGYVCGYDGMELNISEAISLSLYHLPTITIYL